MSAGGVLSSIAKWAALEHRLTALEAKIAANDSKSTQVIHGLIERIVALEAERRTIDAKIAGVGAEARGVAAAASTIASTAATQSLLERIIRLEFELAALRNRNEGRISPRDSLAPPEK